MIFTGKISGSHHLQELFRRGILRREAAVHFFHNMGKISHADKDACLRIVDMGFIGNGFTQNAFLDEPSDSGVPGVWHDLHNAAGTLFADGIDTAVAFNMHNGEAQLFNVLFTQAVLSSDCFEYPFLMSGDFRLNISFNHIRIRPAAENRSEFFILAISFRFCITSGLGGFALQSRGQRGQHLCRDFRRSFTGG